MVDTIKLPVELLGVNNMLSDIAKAHSNVEEHLAKRMHGMGRDFTQQLEQELKGAGVKSGKFKTHVGIPFVRKDPVTGEEVPDVADFTSTVTPGRNPEVERQLKNKQMKTKLRRNMKTLSGIQRAIAAQVKVVDAIGQAVQAGDAPEQMHIDAQQRLKDLRAALPKFRERQRKEKDKAKRAKQRQQAQELKQEARRVTEEYKNFEEVLFERMNLSTPGGIRDAIQRNKEMIREMHPLVKKELVSGAHLRSAQARDRNLRQKLKNMINSNVVRGFQQQQDQILDRLAQATSPQAIQKEIDAQEKLYSDLKSSFSGTGQVPYSQVRGSRRQLRSMYKQLNRTTQRVQREQQSQQKKQFTQHQQNVKVQLEARRDAIKAALDPGNMQSIERAIKEQTQFYYDALGQYRQGGLKSRSIPRSAFFQLQGMQRMRDELEQQYMSPRQRRILEEQAMPLERQQDRRRRRRLDARARLEQMRQSRAQRRSHNIMGLASGGIGLFGQAGFPLLNIAFASMSGGPHAAIAAATTVVGETVRALERVRTGALESAKSLNFLSDGFKEARAELDAYKAFIGGIASVAEERLMQRRLGLANQSGAALNASAAYSALSEKFRGAIMPTDAQGLRDFRKLLSPSGSARFGIEAAKQGKEDLGAFADNMREFRLNMVKQMNMYQARLESPEDMWRRIQTAAASPRSDERKYLRKQVEQIDELIELTKKQLEEIRADERTTSSPIPPLFTGTYLPF